MKLFTADRIRAWDEYTIHHEPVSSIDLMERASTEFCKWFSNQFNSSQRVNIFCGPGNNGGDGLAIARILFLQGFSIRVFVFEKEKCSIDNRTNLERLPEDVPVSTVTSGSDFPFFRQHDIIVDSLFGSGLTRPPEGLYKEVIEKINASGKTVVAVDIASGLFSDAPTQHNAVIKPNYTVTFQIPKISFLLPDTAEYTGELHVLNIRLHQEFAQNATAKYFLTDEDEIFPLIKKRKKFSHKGTFGKALLIGGSKGMIGAMVLASRACTRSGAGLVKVYVPGCGYEIIQSSIPEALASTDPDENVITVMPDIDGFSAIGVGPGISESSETESVLEQIFLTIKVPLVIDAGALNIISRSEKLKALIPPGSMLTPHPKEFERLTGKWENDFEKLEILSAFSLKHKSIIILKGANTCIAFPDGTLHFNSTGNAGMAKGGSGDVLTGILTGLLAQGYTAADAALIGVYLHGYAGDKAAENETQESMLPSDIVQHIKYFFQKFSSGK